MEMTNKKYTATSDTIQMLNSRKEKKMEKKTKQNLLVTVTGVVLFAALINLPDVLNFAGKIISLVLPIIAGGILALFISVPMDGIKNILNRLFNQKKKRLSDKLIHILSFILTIICVVFVLIIVLTLLIPEITQSVQNLFKQIKNNIPALLTYLDKHQLHADWLNDILSDINIEQAMNQFLGGLNILLPNVADALSTTVNFIITAAFSIIISIYITLDRSRIGRHTGKLIRAYLKPEWSSNILRFFSMFYKSFTKFLSGQCGEAVILGTLMFAAFSLCRLPYGNLVGVLTAVCAIIPYAGAFISCSISVLLTMLLDPSLAIRCIIVYLIVQFIENQFIYPKVVGESVGLSPFYTLIAAMIGGKMFGIIGIIFFIPLMAVVVELLKENVSNRLKESGGVSGNT